MALADNLVSYWKLDESSGNASDAVGSNTLTNTGTAAYVSAKINNGVDFGTANTTKYLSAGNLGVAGKSDCTLSFWSKRTNEITASPGAEFFFSWRSQLTTSSYLQVQYNFGAPKAIVINDGGATNSYIVTLGTTFHHFVYTRAGTTGTLYIDGSSAVTLTPGAGGAAGNYFVIGSDSLGGANKMSAIFDEFGFWSRAISSTEVTDLYNSGAGLAYPFSGGAAINSGFFQFM